MTETRTRLLQCFAAVFPNLRKEDLEAASQDTVAAWDSVATITLLHVIEEEFGAAIDFEDLERLTSFIQICDYLGQRQTAAGCTTSATSSSASTK